MRHVLNNNFRQMLASKGMLFVMLLLPVLVFAVSLGLMGGGEGMYRWNIAWVDHDNSALSAGMAETIKPDASRLEAMTAEQADDEILNSKADLAVVVPQGFAQQGLTGAEFLQGAWAAIGIRVVQQHLRQARRAG